MSDETPDPPRSRDDDGLAERLALDAALAEHLPPAAPPPDPTVGQPVVGGPFPANPDGPNPPSTYASEPAGRPGPSEPYGPPAASAPVEPSDPMSLEQTDADASAAAEAAAKRKRGKHRKAPWWELPALVALAIVIAILVKSFLVQPFYIPSQSMEKTLHGCPGCSGDRILVNKVIYDFRDPHPGDIVVFHAPPGWNDETPSVPPSNPVLRVIRGFGQLVGFVPPDGLILVKRVIAVGGQSVKGDANGDVFVKDAGSSTWRKLDESSFVYINGIDPQAKFGPVTVPKGRLWVMGDHRNQSADSRYHCGAGGTEGPDNASCNATAATVPINDVIGKAFVIAWPPSRWRTLGTPTTFEVAAAASAAAPLAGSMAIVLPLFFVRRRRRRIARPAGRDPTAADG